MHPVARTIPVPTTTTDLLLIGGASVLVGWSFMETTNAAGAELQLFDGSNEAGAMIADITLVANESTRDLIPLSGLGVRTSLFLEVISGSIRGAVWVIPGEIYDEYMIEQGYKPVFLGTT